MRANNRLRCLTAYGEKDRANELMQTRDKQQHYARSRNNLNYAALFSGRFECFKEGKKSQCC